MNLNDAKLQVPVEASNGQTTYLRDLPKPLFLIVLRHFT